LQDQNLGAEIAIANFAYDVRKINGVLGFVVRLSSEAARQIGIVAVFIEFPLSIGEQFLRLVESDRSIATNAGTVGIGQ